MAWTTPKTFTAGERLFAQDLNTYVSDNLADLDPRTVKTFADASARTSGITSPTEGMLSYLADTDAVEVYDGSAWTSVGASPAVLQVVQTVKTDTFTTTSATYTDVTGLTASITPLTATNKVLIIAQVSWGRNSGADYGFLRLNGGNADDYVGDAASNRIRAATGGYSASDQRANQEVATLVYLDSPATTSATTYAVQARKGNAGTVYVNRSFNDVDSTDNGRGASSITLIEVAA